MAWRRCGADLHDAAWDLIDQTDRHQLCCLLCLAGPPRQARRTSRYHAECAFSHATASSPAYLHRECPLRPVLFLFNVTLILVFHSPDRSTPLHPLAECTYLFPRHAASALFAVSCRARVYRDDHGFGAHSLPIVTLDRAIGSTLPSQRRQ